MPKKISRRSFLRKIGAAAAVGSAAGIARAKPALAGTSDDKVGILVDLTKCDGCADVPVPRCVTACQTENKARYPEPRDEDVKNYWPQTKHEDWRSKRNVKTTLTPYKTCVVTGYGIIIKHNVIFRMAANRYRSFFWKNILLQHKVLKL